MSRARVVVLRGHAANPWELGTWELLQDRFDVAVAVTRSNLHDLTGLRVERVPVRARRDLLPGGRLGDLAVHVPGDRYLGLPQALEGADIVHAAELGAWPSNQAAALRERLGFRLVLTVWETIPFLHTFLDPVRARRFRSARARTLSVADLFLATTERARRSLRLEGAAPERVEVAFPGIAVERFASARVRPRDRHLLVSPGRLVWEKGHQDVLRALALVGGEHELLVVGSGPARGRLLSYAEELGVAGRVQIRSVPYGDMPAVFAAASAVVLASLPIPSWEEQFGMVLAEAMAAGAPIVASACGAIPEVLDGSGAALFDPGDWPALAGLLRDGPLAREPGTRATYDPAVVRRFSREAAADRLAAAYGRVLAG